MLKPLCRLALVLAIGVGISPAAYPQTRPMNAPTALTQQLAALPDVVFHRRDEAAVHRLPEQAAMSGFQGVLIASARRVDRRADPQANVLVVTGRTRSREQRLRWHDNALLVAVDVDRGAVWAQPAFPVDPSKAPVDQPNALPQPASAPSTPFDRAALALASPDIPPPPEASAGGRAWIDAAAVLDLPRQPMRLALRLFDFDRVSNLAASELLDDGESPGPTPMAEVADLYTRLAATTTSAHPLPSPIRGPATPTALTAPGIAATLSRPGVDAGQPAQPVALHVALLLEPTRPMLIAAPLRGQALPPVFSHTGPPTAVVRASVMVLRPNQPASYLIPVSFPIWSVTPSGAPIAAAFSIDLAAHLPAAALQSGHLVYVLAGRHLAGPLTLGH